MSLPKETVAVIGAGPAGLMAAEVLSAAGVPVTVYDAMPSVGRKFLLAGVGGMNITHSEARPTFDGRYREAQQWVASWLDQFDADRLREWVGSLGLDTFVGSSGRVFPVDMKAAPLLRAWLRHLRAQGVQIHTRHRWTGWSRDGALTLQGPDGEIRVRPAATVLALGGGSWRRLGSDGSWVGTLGAKGVAIRDLRPANCGFETLWSQHLQERFAGQPLKQIIASVTSTTGEVLSRRGECIVTQHGLEGSLIYALSAELRDQLEKVGESRLVLDLAPDRSGPQLVELLSRPRKGVSLSSLLRKRVGLDPLKIALVHERVPRHDLASPERLGAAIKHLEIRLTATRPLDEAISSAGGICQAALDERLMLRDMPGVFCAGEMLDWEAPTGGYLLTACFASGRAAGRGALHWLNAPA
jgi:uncharacterized flavoprotein (TIGR03862 family)